MSRKSDVSLSAESERKLRHGVPVQRSVENSRRKLQNVVTGSTACYVDAARLAHVTRARMTQIMNLTRLAADIQEAVLFLAPVVKGRDPVTERDLRPIAAEFNWTKQRELWPPLIGSEQGA